MQKTTVRSGSNIAFIKYWGVEEEVANIPLNSNISMTLADTHTTTTVQWDEDAALEADKIVMNGQPFVGSAANRIVRHLDRIREMAGIDYHAHVSSVNNFPIASGIASSASGFSALSYAGARAAGLDLDVVELSKLARLGSGSASRSLYGGFVQWDKGKDSDTSFARQILPESHWDLHDVVAVVSTRPKKTSSEGGHKLASTSPLVSARVRSAQDSLPQVVDAIERRDLQKLGELSELDAIAMHAVMMTSKPRLFYWLPATLEIMLAVQDWRESEGLSAYFTIDAGPNVHVLCEKADVAEVSTRLQQIPLVQRIITSGPGPGPQLLDTYLF